MRKEVKVQVMGTRRRKVCKQVTITAPHIVQVYNQNMGAVDLVGFFMSALRYKHKQRKWTVTVLNAVFSICISNAHKVFQRSLQSAESISTFTRKTLEELRQYIHMLDAGSACSTPASKKRKRTSVGEGEARKTWTNKKEYEQAVEYRTDGAVQHCPIKYLGKQTRRCYVCKKRKPKTLCFKCNVPLCVGFVGAFPHTELQLTCFFVAHHSPRFST